MTGSKTDWKSVLYAILAIGGLAGSILSLAHCGTDTPTAASSPSPSPSPEQPAVVYDVHVFAFKGVAAKPENAITDVDVGDQFKVGLTAVAYDVSTGKVIPDGLPPLKVRWRQTNDPLGECLDRGALDSTVEQWVCWESTGVQTADFEGCARNLLDGKEIGCATYGVTVR